MGQKADGDEQLQRLLAIFRVEAAEHMQAMSGLLLALEKPAAGDQPRLIEALFREAHSLKGAARAVNLGPLESLCKTLEAELARLKGEPTPPPNWLETVSRAVEALEGPLAEIATPPAAAAPALRPAEAPAPPVAPVVVAREHAAAVVGSEDTVRISAARLAALQVQAEELLAWKSGSAHLLGELRALVQELEGWRKSLARRARDGRQLRHKLAAAPAGAERWPQACAELLAAGESDERTASACSERLTALERRVRQEQRALAGVVDGLQGDLRQALMQPFAALLELLPRLVRDLARDNGKEAELRLSGTEIEIDRRILEAMKDPLIHLVRNAIDHGLETAAARQAAHKPSRGLVTVAIEAREGNRIELCVADDGAGVDLEAVRASAVRLGLVMPDEARKMGRDEVLALMFESGLTTSQLLTDLSGRGLGLAIVREKVEKLGGAIGVDLPSSGGTRFRLLLPSTLATFRGLVVALGERPFVLPSHHLVRVLRVPAAQVKTTLGHETVELDGQVLALVRLGEVLGLTLAARPEAWLQLAVLDVGSEPMAFAVDAILGEQEVLVKRLGPQLLRVPHLAGATLLGAGQVVPVLHVPELLHSARQLGVRPPLEEAPVPTRSLLVAEDSVTARTLLRDILESAGYRVTTASDGAEAWKALHGGQFDLLVSDVEMPRMDGFALTACIRSDPRLAALPVVLLTALESSAHKARGIEVGANAYVVKSSFDESENNLLEVIRRLT